MKYIDADRLRAEIEFSKSVYSNPRRVVHGVVDAFIQDGRAAMCDDILKKLYSLQQDHLPDAGKMVEPEHIADVSKMMEQPEKIFVEVRHPISKDFTELIGFESRSSDNEVEYIRADVVDETIQTAEDHAYFAGKEKMREELLGWAKETYLNENASAIRKVCYKQLIDKLNSM